MNSGEIDKRTLILDIKWDSPEDSEPSEGEDEDEERLDFYGNDGDDEDEDEDEENDDEGGEENDEEQEESESEIELSPPPSKRKRPAEPLKTSAAPPKKRVAFDLQKPAKVVGLPSRSAPPKSDLKKPTLVTKKRL